MSNFNCRYNRPSTALSVISLLSACSAHHISEHDTTRVYGPGGSETIAGEAGASKSFAVLKKAPAFSPGNLSREKKIVNRNAGLEALKTERGGYLLLE